MQDLVQRAPEGSGNDLYIFSNVEKAHWRARTPGDQTHAEHPGSAINYQDAMYELIAIEPAVNTPYALRYALRAWHDSFQIRQVFPYSAQAARAEHREIIAQREQIKRHTGGMIWFALTSMLPTQVATRWQREWNLPMRRLTYVSIILVASVAAALGPAQLQGGGHPILGRIMLYLAIEQVVRLLWQLRSEDVIGSLALSVLYAIFMTLPGNDPMGKGHTVAEMEKQRDEVRVTEGPWDLEVRSLLRDPALVGASPVRYFGEVYMPLGYALVDEGIRRRYVFRLKKLAATTSARREYFAERTPQNLERLIAYERKKEKVHSLAFLCGLLPASRQRALEKLYDFPAALWSQRSAKTIGIAAVVQAWSLRHEHFGAPHIVAIYFVVECAWRLIAYYAQEAPTGSVLGLLLSPLLPK